MQACFYGANTNQALLILLDVEICCFLDASGFRMAQSPGRKKTGLSRAQLEFQ